MIEFFEKLDALGIQGLVEAQFIFSILFFLVSAVYLGLVYRRGQKRKKVVESVGMGIKKGGWNRNGAEEAVLGRKPSLIDDTL